MKRLSSLIMAAAFVATLAAPAAAQAPAASAPEKKAGDKMEKSGEKMEKKAAAKNASGTVKSASADSLVVAGKAKGKDAEWTFAIDPKTKVKKEGKDAMAADLKAGDPVQVRYTEQDGKMVAQAITVRPAKSEAKKAEPAKK